MTLSEIAFALAGPEDLDEQELQARVARTAWLKTLPPVERIKYPDG